MNDNEDATIKLDPLGCSDWVWRHKYARDGSELRIEQGWRRVSAAVAGAEQQSAYWRGAFTQLLQDFQFLPGGRILAGAGEETGGAHAAGTLCSCFVMGLIEDSFAGIQQAISQGALTMQAGGGTGFDFSTLRPKGDPGYGGDAVAPGPLATARILDAVCQASVTRSGRSGAMMAALRCDHPDIESFIAAKQLPGELNHANLSVLVTDEFMRAVQADAPWPLVFPGQQGQPTSHGLKRRWSAGQVRDCRVYRVISARQLWLAITRAAFDCGEPGVLFIDCINARNNLSGREVLLATNPCAEQPLPAYGACTLGSVNLSRFVEQPFTAQARLQVEQLHACVGTAVRFLDNVVDLARYPLLQQARVAAQTRRIGLGFTGLGDALAMLNLDYASPAAAATAGAIMAGISEAAYRASALLAAEKGCFPMFDADAFARTHRASLLPAETLQLVRAHGLRNSHLTAIAPAGTISLLAGNVSSGIEPIFARATERRVHGADDRVYRIEAESYACHQWHALHGQQRLPDQFVFAKQVPPAQHLSMMAAVQPHVDAGIAKTINLPPDAELDSARQIFDRAYALQLKGCTVFRAGARGPQLVCRA